MYWRYGPFFIPLFLTALVSGAVSALLWPRRSTPGVKSMFALMAALSVWSLAYILELGCTRLEDKLFWANLIYSVAMVIPILWLYFAIDYTGHRYLLRQRVHRVFLWFIPILTILLIWTNPLHSLVRRSIYTQHATGTDIFTFDYGPWFWVSVVWDYLLLLVGSVFLVRSTRGAHPIPRRQAILLIVAVALPWLANIEYSFGRHTLWPFDPAPIAYTISGAIIAIGLWRLGLFELVLAARQVLIEQMEDGWIVTDREGRIVDVNRAACQILGVPGPGQVIGRTVAEILPLNSSMVQDPTSIALPAPEGNRYYDVRRAAVRDHAGRHAGELLVLREISERVRFEEEQARLIADLNAALAQVKKLSGLLPICAICKKIRNDAGYWTEVEEYIASHSEADFTHGICPECMARYYPELLEEEPASRETDPHGEPPHADT